eukprot:Pgem_evm1s13456
MKKWAMIYPKSYEVLLMGFLKNRLHSNGFAIYKAMKENEIPISHDAYVNIMKLPQLSHEELYEIMDEAVKS